MRPWPCSTRTTPPIPGLYAAAGNCAGGFYGPNYPMQVQSGLARAFCTVSGYLAAKNALA